ncbi:MAG TPA: L,D-transpeptidase, partial [Candidatus Saccharimonadales bacterium]
RAVKAKPAPKTKRANRARTTWRRRAVFITVILLALVGLPLLRGNMDSAKRPAAASSVPPAAAKTPPKTSPAKTVPAAAAVAPVTNHCAGNTADQLVSVSIGQRHLWACQGGKAVYDSPVVTGIQYLAADLTPTGTYHIYDKQTDLTLTGSDTTGSWSDPVSYWMPFLHNQYGTYGFHDASWRADSDFGNISPNSADASHGCVELPLATAAWLYNWASVGTAVAIEN